MIIAGIIVIVPVLKLLILILLLVVIALDLGSVNVDKLFRGVSCLLLHLLL